MEVLQPNPIFCPEYWMSLHNKKTSRHRAMNNSRKPKECYTWAGLASEILSSEGFNGYFKYAECEEGQSGGWLHDTFGIWSHVWLEGHNNGKLFIADGTAMQIDSQFELGFFGYLEDASPVLQAVYRYNASK